MGGRRDPGDSGDSSDADRDRSRPDGGRRRGGDPGEDSILSVRWIRFGLSLASMWAAVVGTLAFALTDDLAALWWGMRIAGLAAVASGVTIAMRAPRASGRTLLGVPERYLSGGARVLLGAAIVVATL